MHYGEVQQIAEGAMFKIPGHVRKRSSSAKPCAFALLPGSRLHCSHKITPCPTQRRRIRSIVGDAFTNGPFTATMWEDATKLFSPSAMSQESFRRYIVSWSHIQWRFPRKWIFKTMLSATSSDCKNRKHLMAAVFKRVWRHIVCAGTFGRKWKPCNHGGQ